MSIENLPDSPMGSRKKMSKMFDKMSEWVTPWRSKSEMPRERRILRGDVEQEQFQYASSHCLSSYYSVFVVRLAIMVSFGYFALSNSILFSDFHLSQLEVTLIWHV